MSNHFESLAREDPTVAPLALLQREVAEAAGEPVWEGGVPDFDGAELQAPCPLLHGRRLSVDEGALRHLFSRLIAAAGEAGLGEVTLLREALLGRWRSRPLLDLSPLLQAVICWDEHRMEQMAGAVGIELPLLATLVQQATLPLLQACGRRAAPRLAEATWTAGHCPLCAAWPTLAEQRGLERERWLRCGRCGSGWRFSHQRCPFCLNNDHHQMGYLAPEAEKESRRAMICESCNGYLKTFTTLGAMSPSELAMRDLTSLELDVAALEQEYGRPDQPAFPLQVEVVIAPRQNSWLPWRG